MAGELQASWQAGRTVNFYIRNRIGQIWDTSGGTGAFRAYDSSLFATCTVQGSEQGTASAYYVGTMPAAIPAGTYNVVAKNQIASSGAETDSTVAEGNVEWNGTVLMPLSDVVTSGQFARNLPINMARGCMVRNFPFALKSAADHVAPLVSGIVSGQISRDGGAFGALQSGAVAAGYTETGLGFYSVNLTSGDLLANTVALQFTGVNVSGGNSDPCQIGIVLQRTSGQQI